VGFFLASFVFSETRSVHVAVLKIELKSLSLLWKIDALYFSGTENRVCAIALCGGIGFKKTQGLPASCFENRQKYAQSFRRCGM